MTILASLYMAQTSTRAGPDFNSLARNDEDILPPLERGVPVVAAGANFGMLRVRTPELYGTQNMDDDPQAEPDCEPPKSTSRWNLLCYVILGASAGAAMRVLLALDMSAAMYIEFRVHGLESHVTLLEAAPWVLVFGALFGFVGWKLRARALPLRAQPWLPLLPSLVLTLPWLGAACLVLMRDQLKPPSWLVFALAELYPPSEWMLFLLLFCLAISFGLIVAHLLPTYFERLSKAERMLKTIPWVLAGLFFAVFAVLNVRALLAGHHGYADSGFVAEALWNTLHGRFLHCNYFPNPQLLADHFSPIWIALIPLYLIYPDHATLCVLSAFLLASAIPLSYRLTMVHTGCRLTACVMAIAMFLYAPLTHENSSFTYGFQAELFALPFLLAGFCYLPKSREWDSKSAYLLYGFLFLTLLCKENMALPVTMTGVYLLYQTRDWRRSLPVIGGGFLWGLLTTRWLIPMLKDGSEYYQFDQFYGHIGHSLSEVVIYVITHPGFLLARIVDHMTLTYVVMLLLPLCFLSLRRLDLLAIGSATVFFLIIAQGEAMRSIQQHYKISLIPIILVAAVCGLSGTDKWVMRWCGIGQRGARLGTLATLLICSLSSAYFFGAGPGTRGFRPEMYDRNHPRAESLATLKGLVPREAVLYASHRAAGRFTDRPELHVIDAAHPPPVRPDPDVLVVDLEYQWGFMNAFEAAVETYDADPNYQRIEGYPPFHVFARAPYVEVLRQGNPATQP
jgi:uncharacterized membrane protein